MASHGRLGLLFFFLTTALASGAAAQNVAFDLGGTEAAWVRCPADPASYELFPAHAFGSYYSPGSLVHMALEKGRCSDWPNVGGACVELFVCSLYASGCGCEFSGVLEIPTELELHYDAAAVQAAGVPEESLRLFVFGQIGPQWVEVPGSRADANVHAVRAQATGFVVGFRWYAIAGERTPTAIAPASWSAVKSLWR